MTAPYDALILLSFGGPEGPDDVLPFLENVLRGRNVPQERMLEVAEHYHLFGGVSPLNAQNRVLLTSLIDELNRNGPPLAVYWGNRNWHPLLEDTLRVMADDGVGRALAFATSAFSSYSGCRQYLDDIERARAAVGPAAPEVDKLRVFFDHPGFIEPMAQRVAEGLAEVEAVRQARARLLFSAHSIPVSMAQQCRYEQQLREACRLVAQRVGRPEWELVYQSRSGPPSQPWLEPDVCSRLAELGRDGVEDVVLAPIGFLSEHIEVLYDLDVEAAEVAQERGIRLIRTGLVQNHPRFVQMIRELVLERVDPAAPRLALSELGDPRDTCPPDCCRVR